MKRPPRAREVTHARDAIRAALDFHRLTSQVRGERVVAEWVDLVGPRIAQRTRPDRIVDRVLWIEVASSAWLHELNLLKPQLLRGLLERLGEPPLFDDLRLRLAGGGPRREAVVVPRGRRHAPAAPPPEVRPATGAAREAIVREVAAVDDDDLRELIARVRITHDR